MVRKKISLLLLVFSFINAQDIIKLTLDGGKVVKGEFIGTYMGYVHLLIGDNLRHFDCDDIQTATEFGNITIFEYDCSKNTVTEDILFPPQLNPMTGEWDVLVPDFLKRDKVRLLTENKEKLNSDSPAKQKTFKKAIANRALPNQNLKQNDSDSRAIDKSSYSYAENEINVLTEKLTERELRKIIKKEVREELRKVLPYEIKKHKETKQSRLFQNILLGCGAWFIFMLILS
mgnify:CR=1 FL=1